ncbi:hypothetical protein AX761_23340 [Rhizobium sp. 58]|nr:hypothetical protein AX761_23340 [Rhizobium sp. 58]
MVKKLQRSTSLTPASPALGALPTDTNLAGDVAAAVVTGDATGLVQDGAVSVAAVIGAEAIIFTDTPESGPATGEAGNQASLSAVDAVSIDVHPDWKIGDEDSFSATHPLTFAMVSGHKEMTQPILRITPKVAGFRRGGIAHPAGVTDYNSLSLSPSAVEAILSEPALVVEIV